MMEETPFVHTPTEDIGSLHVPVMLERAVDVLRPALDHPGAIFVDGTLGMGGHSEAFLTHFPKLQVIGLDRDTDAIALATRRLAPFADRFTAVHTVFDGMREAVADTGATSVAGILLDLGVSSLQLDHEERGFAYAKDAPLDMRMNQAQGRTAADILAQESEGRLRELFEKYGDEPLAGRYARAIVQARNEEPITQSGHLVDILQEATPAAVKKQRHPAKRVFQALRIEVNDELGAIRNVIPHALDLLQIGGRIVVMSYQSLEDRIVKQAFRQATTSTAPQGLPVELPEHQPRFTALTRKPEGASAEEQARNPRSIPVRFRALERVR